MSVARSLVFLVGASLLGCTSNPPGLGVDAGDTGSDAGADTDIDSDVDADTDACEDVLEWVPIEGGVFMMGGPEDTYITNQLPVHEVTVPSFEMTRTEITAAQLFWTGVTASKEVARGSGGGSRMFPYPLPSAR